MTHQAKLKYVGVVLLLIVFASSSTFVEGLDKKERTLPREFFNFSGQNRKTAESRWFSVGIFKYKPGYKSHDLL